jgi:mannitol/fructose-specific phosphotransferase system IIA component (Ntr-type)
LRLIDYIDPGCVKIGKAEDKESTLQLMVDLVTQSGLVDSRESLMTALKQREDVVSTGIGNSVAIPHADLPGIQEPRLAVGVFPDGVDFDALDEEPVYIVFLLLGTPRTPGLHMKILARIARLSKDAEFASGLRRATGADDVLNTLRRLEAKH